MIQYILSFAVYVIGISAAFESLDPGPKSWACTWLARPVAVGILADIIYRHFELLTLILREMQK